MEEQQFLEQMEMAIKMSLEEAKAKRIIYTVAQLKALRLDTRAEEPKRSQHQQAKEQQTENANELSMEVAEAKRKILEEQKFTETERKILEAKQNERVELEPEGLQQQLDDHDQHIQMALKLSMEEAKREILEREKIPTKQVEFKLQQNEFPSIEQINLAKDMIKQSNMELERDSFDHDIVNQTISFTLRGDMDTLEILIPFLSGTLVPQSQPKSMRFLLPQVAEEPELLNWLGEYKSKLEIQESEEGAVVEVLEAPDDVIEKIKNYVDNPHIFTSDINNLRNANIAIFVDMSNISQGGILNISAAKLLELTKGLRHAARKYVGGSFLTREQQNIFQREEFDVNILSPVGAKEQAVDDIIHNPILIEIQKFSDCTSPPKIVILTGNGNSNDERSTFPDIIDLALRKERRVELWSWRQGLSGKYLEFLQNYPSHFAIHYFDEYRSFIVNGEVKTPKGRGKPCLNFLNGKCSFGLNCHFLHQIQKPCMNFQKGSCLHGSKCYYLHNDQKTWCTYFQNGSCSYGSKCKFLHNPQRQVAGICPYYANAGKCNFGTNCKFEHPERRNRAPEPFIQSAIPLDILQRLFSPVPPLEMHPKRPGVPPCPHYIQNATCKLGIRCNFDHPSIAPGEVQKPCFNFLRGNCLYGSKCKFLHNAGMKKQNLEPDSPEGKRPCGYFFKSGSCHYGSNCTFSHAGEAKTHQGEHEEEKKLPDLIEEEKQRCINCDQETPLENVIECTNPNATDFGPHYYCLECFQGGYAENQLSTEYRTQFIDHRFRFTCRWCEPELVFLKGTELEILSLLGEAGLMKYIKAREDTAHMQAEEKTEDRIRRQLENKSRVDKHLFFIAENILTLQCPRCKQAIGDFEGCFAVRHGKDLNGCGCAFCAWCLKDCGNDAHPHVRVCELNPKPGNLGYMDNAEDAENLKHVENLRRRAAIVKYFSESVPEEDRVILAKEIEVSLHHLGITPLGVSDLGMMELNG